MQILDVSFFDTFVANLDEEFGSFPLSPPPPVEAVAAATSVFTEYILRDSAHNSQISSIFQEADCLLKLLEVNK